MALYDWLAFYQREYQAVGRVFVLAFYVSKYLYLFPTPTVTLNVQVCMVRSVSQICSTHVNTDHYSLITHGKEQMCIFSTHY